ncbi:MAG: hypothetical protein M3Y42_00760 [Actinomycetota bacterium]|nr:hypothetical protein [Actinomycetota bacterium]MDQ2955481.1 hypothetical protein [Actinomycetota bacterium]
MLTLPSTYWSDFYKGIQARANVPDDSITTIDRAHAVFQAMYLDLAEIKVALRDSGFNPPLVTVVADVLNVPAGTTWLLQNSVLQVQARRLQTGDEFRVNLDYRSGTTASLLLFCAELDGSIRATAIREPAPPDSFPIDAAPADGGVRVYLADGVPTKGAVSWAQGVPVELPPWFEQSLRTEFIYASLLYDGYPEIAVSQFAWLKNWSGYNSEVLGIFLQSSSLLALLTAEMNATANGTRFVPYLSRTVYANLADAFVAEAQQYESDYRALSIEKVVTDQFIELAKSMLANKTYESEYTTKLLAQAKSNFDNAVAATNAAQKTLTDAELKAEMISIDFQKVGIPEWEREQIAKAIIELSTAIVTFAVGIGVMFLGDPAGGGAAVAGAVEGAKAAEAAAQAGSEIATLAKQLSEVMEKLKKVGEALKKVYELAQEVMKAVDDIQNAGEYAEKMREMGVDGNGADLTATYEWQVYQQASDATLQGPVDLGIQFAPELKLAIDAVAIYGQALAAAQVATIAAGQTYAAVSLQQQLAQQQQAEMQRYVDSLVKGETPLIALMQRFYELYLNAKSSLFAAIQGYRDSYYYWALQPSTIRPSIIDGVDGLDTGLKNLTSIALDNQSALAHFVPPPQVLTDKRFVIDAPEVLRQLANGGETRWVLPLDANPFANFDRVRLTKVRVWIEGAKVKAGQSINVLMSTQGNYLDRFDGKNYQFTSKPLTRDFEYRVTDKRDGTPDWRFENGTYGYVEVDGVVDTEVSYAYFQPTPFAEWSISLVKTPGVDLSGVTRLTMQFAGSVIPEA